jgi:hypothetical protein
MEQPPINDWFALINGRSLLIAALALLVLVVAVIFIWRRLRRRVDIVIPPPVDLGIDVSQLPQSGPMDPTLQVEIYGTPVRIAVIVLAPVGRDGVVPQMHEFLDIIEQLVPNFAAAVNRDRPLIRAWSGQLSSQGFANSFFNNVPLPGDRGKGSPWCSLVGKFTANKQQFLAGIVCCGSGDNALSQYAIQHEGQWNDILRVRRTPSQQRPL